MLKERISILENAGVISAEVAEFVNQVIDEDLVAFMDKESVLEMFTTHLAMAAQRICTGQEVETLDESIWNEVVNSSGIHQAEKLYETLMEKSPCTFQEGEKRFLLMHLCNLYQ